MSFLREVQQKYVLAEAIRCQMTDDCQEPVTHIDDNGFIYCAEHGQRRKESGRRCRKLKPAELKTLKEGKPIAKY